MRHHGQRSRSPVSDQQSAISGQRSALSGQLRLSAHSRLCVSSPLQLFAPNHPLSRSPLRLRSPVPLPPWHPLILSPSKDAPLRFFAPTDDSVLRNAQGGRREEQNLGRAAAHGAGRKLRSLVEPKITARCGQSMGSITKVAGDIAVSVGHGCHAGRCLRAYVHYDIGRNPLISSQF